MTAYGAVLLYGALMMVLTLSYAFPRVPLALLGKRQLDSWERDKVNPDSAIFQRMKHAHLNMTESFPVFASVIVIAGLLDNLPAVTSLAPWVLYLRVGQVVAHISGTGVASIGVRATCFVGQVLIIGIMIFQILS
nr:MAPEG family protein [Oceanococcus sp. HetDA_MAG_MS8]